MSKRGFVKTNKASGTVARRAQQQQRIQSARANVMQHNQAFSSRARAAMASKETGFVDLAAATYGGDTTGSVTLIATVAQGASVNQRVGKKIALKSVQMRGNVSAGTAGVVADCTALLIYDRRPTGALPAIGDILVSASATAFPNDANSGRFRTLRRFNYVLCGNTTAAATGTEIIDIDEFIDLKLKPCVYKAAGTGAIGDIEEGALYLVTCGNQAAGTTAANINVAFRTRFVDV